MLMAGYSLPVSISDRMYKSDLVTTIFRFRLTIRAGECVTLPRYSTKLPVDLWGLNDIRGSRSVHSSRRSLCFLWNERTCLYVVCARTLRLVSCKECSGTSVLGANLLHPQSAPFSSIELVKHTLLKLFNECNYLFPAGPWIVYVTIQNNGMCDGCVNDNNLPFCARDWANQINLS